MVCVLHNVQLKPPHIAISRNFRNNTFISHRNDHDNAACVCCAIEHFFRCRCCVFDGWFDLQSKAHSPTPPMFQPLPLPAPFPPPCCSSFLFQLQGPNRHTCIEGFFLFFQGTEKGNLTTLLHKKTLWVNALIQIGNIVFPLWKPSPVCRVPDSFLERFHPETWLWFVTIPVENL